MPKIQIPVTDSSSRVVDVPDHFKLADALQLALNQLGDGFFAFKGSIDDGTGGGVRPIKDLNGEVIPGTGLQVKVRDLAALIDGVILTDKNKAQFNPTNFALLDVTAAVGAGEQHIILKPKRVLGSDGFDRPNFDRGDLQLSATEPASDSGEIIVALIEIPSGTTQVDATMIDNSKKDYLVDLDEETLNRKVEDAALSASADLAITRTLIDIAKTNFKVDAHHDAAANDLFKGWVDVLADDSDIDDAASTDEAHDGGRMVVAGPIAGLEMEYKFEEPSGSPTALDTSGNNRHLSLFRQDGPISRTNVGGISNQYLVHPLSGSGGSDLFGVLPSVQYPVMTDMTVSIFVFIDPGLGDGNSFLMNKPSDPAVDWRLFLHRRPPETSWRARAQVFKAEGGFIRSTSTFALTTNAWHHIAFTVSPSTGTLKGYIDGALYKEVNQAPFTRVEERFRDPFSLNIEGSFAGRMDEIGILSRVLSAADIAAINTRKNHGLPPATSATVISKAHTATAVPTDAMIVAEGSGDIVLSVSRDDGTTFTPVTNGTLTSIIAQPSGTAVRYKVDLPAVDSFLDNIAVFWK